MIPVKSLMQSKRRLAHILAPEARAQLIAGLLRRELALLKGVPALREVLVISSDPQVWEIARGSGALVVEEEPVSPGLNAAVSRGMRRAAEEGAEAVLILPVDLPYIDALGVEMMLGSGQIPCEMAVCADEAGSGTNALFLHPARDFGFHFGPGSFHKHMQEAQERGREVRVISAPGLKFDIDNESDWLVYQASSVGC